MSVKQRVCVVAGGLICSLFLLIGRLWYIQVLTAESFGRGQVNLLEKSVQQRTHTIVLHDGRGRFADRNGKLLVEDSYPSVIIFPFAKHVDLPFPTLSRFIGLSEPELKQQLAKANEPILLQKHGTAIQLTEQQMKEVNALRIPGVVAADVQVQQAPALAAHFLGVTGQNERELKRRYPKQWEEKQLSKNTSIGISGLQQAFDEFLLTDGETKLLYHVDQHGAPMLGNELKYQQPANPFYPVTIQTTIDKELQQTAEQLLEQSSLQKGGLVLLDVKTNEILALVSKPALSTKSTAAYQHGAINYMLIPQFPGSVFKTVIAAAALDLGLVARKRTFDCNQDAYGEGAAERQLGELSFTESFSQSCNRTFAELGKELLTKDKNAMERYAAMLGLTGTVGWRGDLFHFQQFRQLPEEQPGLIWHSTANRTDADTIAQTAIGQKDVRFSPLAVANMMATIARGGEKREVKAVREILYKNGARMYRFPDHELEGKTLSRATIQALQMQLRHVVTEKNGTGASYQALPLAVAGKSGTAQTGKGASVNRWFAGYFPATQPRYALVVVELESVAKHSAVTPIFSSFVREIAAWEKR